MFGRDNEDAKATTRLTYRPAVTVVRFSGDRTTTTDTLAPPDSRVTVKRAGTATIVVRADPRQAYSIQVPTVKVDTLKATLTLLEDGRLSGSSATYDDRSADVMGAVIKTGVAAGALALSLGAPPVGIALGAVAAGAAAAVGSGGAGFNVAAIAATGAAAPAQTDEYAPAPADGETTEPEPVKVPTPEELGIDAEFNADMPADHERLYRYRLALLQLTLAHTFAASDALTDTGSAQTRLKQLDRILASTRAEASRAEDVYAVWRKSKQQTTTDHVDEQFFVDELPSTERLKHELREDLFDHDDARWWDVATRTGLMVTCDLEDPNAQTRYLAAPAGTSFSDGTVVYRPPVPAKLTTWKLEPAKAGVGKWCATVTDTQWIQVTHPAVTSNIRIPLTSTGDAQVDLGFAASGALTSYSTDRSGPAGDRAQAIAALPADLAAAAKSGGELASSLSPATARVASLKQRVDEAEQRQKLNGLLNPAPDDFADLKTQLAEAELQARLAIATRTIQDPSSVFVAVEQTSDGG